MFNDEDNVGILTALRNYGADVTCGACMEIAFTGVTSAEHTCTSHSSIEITKEEALALVIELQHTFVSHERQRIIYDLLGRLRQALDLQK